MRIKSIMPAKQPTALNMFLQLCYQGPMDVGATKVVSNVSFQHLFEVAEALGIISRLDDVNNGTENVSCQIRVPEKQASKVATEVSRLLCK
jgi:hypothetical protein